MEEQETRGTEFEHEWEELSERESGAIPSTLKEEEVPLMI